MVHTVTSINIYIYIYIYKISLVHTITSIYIYIHVVLPATYRLTYVDILIYIYSFMQNHFSTKKNKNKKLLCRIIFSLM